MDMNTLQNDSCEHKKNNSHDDEYVGLDIKMAFQPIVDVQKKDVVGYEALVRGPNGESAGWVLDKINKEQQYQFDQQCRFKAIETASKLDCHKHLFINFCPNAVEDPNLCIRSILQASGKYKFPVQLLVFEITESEQIENEDKVVQIKDEYHRNGFLTAIDDFGSGYAGLGWLSQIKPDIVKIDMSLIRDIHKDHYKLSILKGTLLSCYEMNITVLAEGVQNEAEFMTLFRHGVRYMQGFYFSKPRLEKLVCLEDIEPFHQASYPNLDDIVPKSCLFQPDVHSAHDVCQLRDGFEEIGCSKCPLKVEKASDDAYY